MVRAITQSFPPFLTVMQRFPCQVRKYQAGGVGASTGDRCPTFPQLLHHTRKPHPHLQLMCSIVPTLQGSAVVLHSSLTLFTIIKTRLSNENKKGSTVTNYPPPLFYFLPLCHSVLCCSMLCQKKRYKDESGEKPGLTFFSSYFYACLEVFLHS